MKKLCLCLTIFVTGCAIGKGVKPTFQKGGQQFYEAKCNGMVRSMSDCYALASETCGGDFQTFDQNKTNDYLPNYRGQGVMTVENRTLIFSCK